MSGASLKPPLFLFPPHRFRCLYFLDPDKSTRLKLFCCMIRSSCEKLSEL